MSAEAPTGSRLARAAGFAAALALLLFSLSEGVLNRHLLERPWWTALVLVVGVAAVYLPFLARVRRAVSHVLFGLPRRRYNLVLFACAVCLYAAASWVLFDGTPRLDDEVSALFQARILASGQWMISAPQPPAFFRMFGNIDGYYGYPHLCSMYPPGHPALLALGVLAGAPWLVNPLLGGGLAVLVAELARQLYDRRTGRLAGLFALLSPFVLVLSGTHLSHVPAAFFLTLCMWAVVRLLRARRWLRFGALAGCAMGMAFLCRPLTAFVVGVVIGLAPLWYWRRALRRWQGVAAALLLAAAGVGLLLAYQQAATGDWRKAGHEVGMGRRAKFGFVEIDWARTHTPAIGVDYTARRLNELNDKVLGWPVPLYLVALLPFLLGRGRKEDVWLLLPSLGLLATYMAYWYWEQYFPARYIFSGVPMLIVLAARGCTGAGAVLGEQDRVGRPDCGSRGRSPSRLREPVRGASMARAGRAVLSACILFNLAVFLPHRTDVFGGTYADVETVLPRVLAAHDLSGSVLFMDSIDRLPDHTDPFNDFYATGFMRNALGFDGDILFARNLKERNHELAAMHPDRAYYLYRYHRGLGKALLYRIYFDGVDQQVVPVPSDSPYLITPE